MSLTHLTPLRSLIMTRWIAAALAAAGCAEPNVHTEPVAVEPPPTGTEEPTTAGPACAEPGLTWENTGQPFMHTWCDSCHAASQTPSGRLGAPVSVSFDTLAETRTWAARIDARSLAVPATMPPATTIPEVDLAPVRAWFACGLPGDDAPAPVATCALPAYAGDVRLSEVDPAFCDSYSAIDGDLAIDTDSGALACLCDVSGDVVFDGFSGHEASFPQLGHAGSLSVTGVSTLVTLDLPELVLVDGDIDLDGLSALESLRLPLLQRVGGSVLVRGAALLGSVDAYRLAEVGGGLTLTDVPSLSWFLPFDTLTSVGGDLVVRGTGAVEAQDFRRLATVGGSLEIASNAALVSLEGYDVLASIGGDLSIHDNPNLALLDALPVLDEVGGGVLVRGNPSLPNAQVHALVAGIDEIGAGIHLDRGDQ